MSYVIETVSSVAELEQDESWWSIYEQSIAAPLRASRGELLRVFSHPMTRFFRCREGGDTIAMATTQLLVDPSVVFLGYFCVAPSARRRGLGRKFLEACAAACADAHRAMGSQSIGLLLEAERGGPRKWYRSAGFEALACHYEQPPLGGSSPVPLALMFRAAPGMENPSPELQLAMVRALYEQKYRESYQVPQAIIEALLARCAASLGIAPPPASGHEAA